MYRVLESWELAKQKYSCDIQVGTEILLNIFELQPEYTKVFGFASIEDIDSDPRCRRAFLVQASRIVGTLDELIDLLGPDTDILDEILSQTAKQDWCQRVAEEFFPLLVQATCQALQDTLIDDWNKATQTAWQIVLNDMAEVVTNAM